MTYLDTQDLSLPKFLNYEAKMTSLYQEPGLDWMGGAITYQNDIEGFNSAIVR